MLGTPVGSVSILDWRGMLHGASTEPAPSAHIEKHGTTPRFYEQPEQAAFDSSHVHDRNAVEYVRRMIF